MEVVIINSRVPEKKRNDLIFTKGFEKTTTTEASIWHG